jgi:hypothetical protein
MVVFRTQEDFNELLMDYFRFQSMPARINVPESDRGRYIAH